MAVSPAAAGKRAIALSERKTRNAWSEEIPGEQGAGLNQAAKECGFKKRAALSG